jgi:hypothetical protein
MIDTPSAQVLCRISHLKCKVRIETPVVRTATDAWSCGDLCYLVAVLPLVIVNDSLAGGIGRLIARKTRLFVARRTS